MSTKSSNLKILNDRREKLRSEYEAAKARLDEVEGLIKLLGGETTSTVAAPSEARTRRGDLKSLVLELYEEAGENGLSATGCVRVAAGRNIEIQPSSVSSLLSRLKSDGILFYDGDRYRLKKYAGPRPTREAI